MRLFTMEHKNNKTDGVPSSLCIHTKSWGDLSRRFNNALEPFTKTYNYRIYYNNIQRRI